MRFSKFSNKILLKHIVNLNKNHNLIKNEFHQQNFYYKIYISVHLMGFFGLVYRPVSTANGKQPLLKFDKIRLCCLFKTSFTYELTFKKLLNFL